MYNHLFGPVPSRRLGVSLGIDLVPHKVCSFNCVYCECGRTTLLTLKRQEYVSRDKVIEEVTHFLSNNPSPDYITFSGAGEPTLNTRLGEILRLLKTSPSPIPVAVLTNGSLLNDPQVQEELSEADVILPSLDAASETTFRRMDRPIPSFNLENYIQGMVDFSQIFKGKIWLEVMILPGFNDNKKDLRLLKEAFLRIEPDKIQLNTLDRPGTLKNLKPAPHNLLLEILDYWEVDNCEIICAVPERRELKSYRQDIETAILETIARRPCTVDDLSQILGLHVNEVNKYLGVLEEEKRIKQVKQARGVFYGHL